jgi:hypothetical protein
VAAHITTATIFTFADARTVQAKLELLQVVATRAVASCKDCRRIMKLWTHEQAKQLQQLRYTPALMPDAAADVL